QFLNGTDPQKRHTLSLSNPSNRIDSGQFMEDLVKFAVDTASKLGASYSEARFQKNEGIRLVFKNGIPDPAGFTKKSGIAIRVLVNGALGFACTNTMTKDRVRASVESAYRTARQSGRLVKTPIKMAGKTESHAKW